LQVERKRCHSVIPQERDTVAQQQPKSKRVRYGGTNTTLIQKSETRWHNHSQNPQELDTVAQPQLKSARAKQVGTTTA
jgi:hypothetical protein